MIYLLLVFAVFWVAYSNGANDNFKGVATLYGSNALSFKGALRLATVATVLGSLVSILAAEHLLHAFSGKGLVPDAMVGHPELLLAVAAAGAVTILLATWLGMPTSTTHALTGGLLGAGLVLGGIQGGAVWKSFFLPLMISPLLAIVLTALIYPVFHRLRLRMGIGRETCVCVDVPRTQMAATPSGVVALSAVSGTVVVDSVQACEERYQGSCVGIHAQSVVQGIHGLSGAVVCFGRAVNDTPKIAALLLVAGGNWALWQLSLVAAAMAMGGVLNARKVAETMSRRITDFNPGQGLTANLVTAGLVLGASHMGVPVSTTHVSCGAIFGIGASQGTACWKTIGQILLAWVTTLPLAAVLAAVFYRLL